MTIGILEEHALLGAGVRRWAADADVRGHARASLDAEVEDMPGFWPDLAAQGWLGLHVDEAHGGGGFGMLESCVVAEELGRAMAPGPALPTMAASAVLQAYPPGDGMVDVLAGLADGSVIGAVAFECGELAGRSTGTGLRLGGVPPPVLSAHLADVVLLGARDENGRDSWFVANADEVDVRPCQTLDATRRAGRIEADLLVDHTRLLPGCRTEDVRALAAPLLAAEAVGQAGWCLDTTVAYVRLREQFGRPVGQFQAVKHRCADMLVGLEQAAALAWDAATAVTASDQRLVASPLALASAIEAAYRCAKDCMQLHGGIGLTWEHDAHLYFKRAATVRALLSCPAREAARGTQVVLGGSRRRLDVDLPPASRGLRDRVGRLVDEVTTAPEHERRERLATTGLLMPHLPRPWGLDADATLQLVIAEELATRGVERPHLEVGAWVVPTLVQFGTQEQQRRLIGPTLRGELRWCQMFSEPGAGSDLASLTTRAVRVEGGWSVTGQKVWTSRAHHAHLGICLARTDPAARRHRGITCFVVDVRGPGVEIRPLRRLSGDSIFSEVFLSEAFVPDRDVVGAVDDGWRVARTTLANERVVMGSRTTFGADIERVLDLAAGAPTLDADQQVRLGQLLAESQALRLLELRSVLAAVRGTEPGPTSSVRKLLGVEHEQRVAEFGFELLGPWAVSRDDYEDWTYALLATRVLTVGGGTSEIQRNVIAERLLGLPRDPRPEPPEQEASADHA